MANKALTVYFRLPCALGLQESVSRVRYGSFMVTDVAWWTKELGIQNIIMMMVG